MDKPKSISGKEPSSFVPLTLNRQGIITVVAVGIVLWICAGLLWVQGDLDSWFLISLDGLRANESLVAVARAVSKYGMAVITLVYLVYLSLASKNEKLQDATTITLLVILMFGLVGPFGDLLKAIFNRPRPIVGLAGQITAFSSVDTPAIPSGHATKSTALALPFILLVAARDRWQMVLKVFLATVALAVCTSRVVLGAHYVSDVLAGIGLALICFPLVNRLTNKFLGRIKPQKLQTAIRVWALVLFVLLVYLILN